MLNEDTIKQNSVCYKQGKADMLNTILFEMELKDRKSIKKSEVVALLTEYQIDYEKAWNAWADYSHIGGSRFDETGRGQKK